MNTYSTYLHIPGLLSAGELRIIAGVSDQAVYENVKPTVYGVARDVKNNLQLNYQAYCICELINN